MWQSWDFDYGVLRVYVVNLCCIIFVFFKFFGFFVNLGIYILFMNLIQIQFSFFWFLFWYRVSWFSFFVFVSWIIVFLRIFVNFYLFQSFSLEVQSFVLVWRDSFVRCFLILFIKIIFQLLFCCYLGVLLKLWFEFQFCYYIYQ